MSKTPEELTAEWKAGKLPQWKFYYIAYDGGVEPLLLNGENDFINHCRIINSLVKRILAPVPTYDEYKAMHAAIQNGESAIDTNKRICKTIEELKEQLADKDYITEEQLKKLRGGK